MAKNKKRRFLGIGIGVIAAIGLLAFTFVGLQALAVSDSGGEVGIEGNVEGREGEVAIAASAVTNSITYQGRLTDSTGEPLSGTWEMVFELYNVSTGGTALATDRHDVNVTDGLFNTHIDFGTDYFDGRELWLGVTVKPGSEMTPRQEILPVPYALGLKPGAHIEDFSHSAIFSVTNTGNGHAIVGSCSSSGVIGASHSAGVYGEATNTEQDEINYGGFFISKGGHGSGVYGGATGSAGEGVFGEAAGINGQGVRGYAPGTNAVGVYGVGSTGVFGEGSNGDGVIGKTTAADKSGVYGHNPNGVGVKGRSDNGDGVVGWTGASDKSGVFGHSQSGVGITGRSDGDAGVVAVTTSTNPDHVALVARNEGSGPAIYAESGTNGYAAIFEGNVQIQSRFTGAPVIELGEGLDYAEGFDVSHKTEIVPGTVLIIDPDNPGKLAVSNEPYDRKVAGIVTGANGMGSGVRLGSDQFDYDVALAGRVYCNVDATHGEVSPGDLLTTSPTPGYAMVVKDYAKAQGAILGKAMEELPQGEKGQILVLVALQ
jgi:hypothetical protein